jgi:L-threonylcarbamoyladenylate synthase
MPAHPVALALIRASALPLAAPSANRSSRLSPTQAEHVARSLGDRIDLILDGGPTRGGLESTVLDVSTSPPRLLRPGLVAPADIEAVIGPILRPTSPTSGVVQEPARSPGTLRQHYAPRTPLECVAEGNDVARIDSLLQQGLKVAWLTFADRPPTQLGGLLTRHLARDATRYAAQLYAALHDLDEGGVDRIVVTLPPDSEDWLAVHDRLRRACHD